VCALAECTSTVYCIWTDDGSVEQKHVAEFLVLITDICCVIDWINYCIGVFGDRSGKVVKVLHNNQCFNSSNKLDFT
jgi:hypothetical protein